MFAEALQVQLNGITNLTARFLARPPLGDTARKSGTGDDKHAIFVLLNVDAVLHGSIIVAD